MGEDFLAMTGEPVAVVAGANGGIGKAIADGLEARGGYGAVLRLSRQSSPPLDLLDEASIAAAATHVKTLGVLRLFVDATGFLHGDGIAPEKAMKQMTPDAFARAFAVNATGPALLMKHFLPGLPREGRALFATLSAKVGSIGDNALGGWHAYRASKAALNQIVKTVSIELKRTHPHAIVVALHPGTVDTALSRPFARNGLKVRPPETAAAELLGTLDTLGPQDSGTFVSYDGSRLPW